MYEASDIYDLRRENKLNEAYQLAIRLHRQDPDDEYIAVALGWVLYSLCKNAINSNNLNQARTHLNEFEHLHLDDEMLEENFQWHKRRLNPAFNELQKIKKLKDEGKLNESLNIYRTLKRENRLPESEDEWYAWLLFKLFQQEKDSMPELEQKKLFKEYLDLNNPRPSKIHSIFLNTVLIFAKNHKIDFYAFLKLWDASEFRNEDADKEGKFPSLIEKSLSHLIEHSYKIDPGYLRDEIKLSGAITARYYGSRDELKIDVIDTLREKVFWKIYQFHKEKKFGVMHKEFNYYLDYFSGYGPSEFHSKVLSLASNCMEENESNRYLEFIQKWGIENYREEDWQEEIGKDGKSYQGIAQRTLKRARDIIKNENIKDVEWIIPAMDVGLDKHPDDIWLYRDKGLFLVCLNKIYEAKKILRDVLKENKTSAWAWADLGDVIVEENTGDAIACYCMGLLNEKNEDFLGGIHLKLAGALKKIVQIDKAKTEYKKYIDHREKKGWKISDEVQSVIQESWYIDTNTEGNNSEFYQSKIKEAEEIAYDDLEWVNTVFLEKFKNDKGKEIAVFYSSIDGKDTILKENTKSFKELKGVKPGKVYKAKIFYSIKLEKPKVLLIKSTEIINWTGLNSFDGFIFKLLEKDACVIAYQHDKGLYQTIVYRKPSDFEIKNGISVNLLGYKDVTKLKVFHIEENPSGKGFSQLPEVVAVVDGINRNKRIGYFVTTDNISGVFEIENNDIKEYDFLNGRLLTTKKTKKESQNSDQNSGESLDDFKWDTLLEVAVQNEVKHELLDIKIIEKHVGLDLFETKLAVIDSINKLKKNAHFIVNEDCQGSISLRFFPIKLEEGDFVEVKVIAKKGKKGDQYYQAISVEKTNKVKSDILSEESGIIQINRGNEFGFIRNRVGSDCFVNPKIIMENNISDGDYIKVLAIQIKKKISAIKFLSKSHSEESDYYEDYNTDVENEDDKPDTDELEEEDEDEEIYQFEEYDLEETEGKDYFDEITKYDRSFEKDKTEFENLDDEE